MIASETQFRQLLDLHTGSFYRALCIPERVEELIWGFAPDICGIVRRHLDQPPSTLWDAALHQLVTRLKGDSE